MARFEAYTATGIKRIPCVRCGARPGHAQWNVCADKVGKRTQFRVLCKACDVGMNEMAMRYVFGDDAEDRIDAYRAEIGA
jgi:hypothetical protein